MRTIQEQENLRRERTIREADKELIGKLETRLAMRNLGTVANLPPVAVGYPAYDEEGNEIRYMRYGDAYGEYPLKP